jgi:murein L,D-transpeptidase YafK
VTISPCRRSNAGLGSPAGWRRTVERAMVALAASLAWITAAAGGMEAAAMPPSADAQLQRAIADVHRGALTSAMGEIDRLIERFPNFRLAHLVRGDLLLSRAQPIAGLGNAAPAGRERLEDLRAEALARARAGREAPPADRVPRYLLQLEARQTSAIVVDAERSRVYVYATGGGAPRLVRNFYSSIGKLGIGKERESDKKTPIGVYRVTSWLSGKKLPDLYGSGAYPIDYPNARDRLLGRTGYGIWIHGVPSDTYARAPLASDGCVALANPDLQALAAYVRPGATPVVIARQVEWVAPDALRADRDSFLSAFDAWRRDWESKDVERYLAHYAKDFRTSDKDLQGWKAHKRRVSAGKSWIKIEIDKLSVLRDPGAKELVSVTFDQDYRSSNLSQRTRKRQYWAREGANWKIVYEAPVQAPVLVLVLPESYPTGARAEAQAVKRP